MAEKWFMERGARGTTTIKRDQGDWIIADCETAEQVVVSLPEDAYPETRERVQVTATVTTFTYGGNSDPNYLYLEEPIRLENHGKSLDEDKKECDEKGERYSKEEKAHQKEKTKKYGEQNKNSEDNTELKTAESTTNSETESVTSGNTEPETDSEASNRSNTTGVGVSYSESGTSNSESSKATQGATGTVTEYIEDGGYGFATTSDIGRRTRNGSREPVDVFVHISNLPTTTMEIGWRLQFDIKQTDQGFEAENITILSKDNSRVGADNNRQKPEQPRTDRATRPSMDRSTRDGDGPKRPPDDDRWR